MAREEGRNVYRGYIDGEEYDAQRNTGSGNRMGAEYSPQRAQGYGNDSRAMGYGNGNRAMGYAEQNQNFENRQESMRNQGSRNRREDMQSQGGRRNGMRRGWEDDEWRPSSEYASMQDDMEEDVEEFTREMAEHWTSEMENADGTRGAHWRMDQALSLMQQVGAHAEPHVFYAIVNNMYRLYSKAAKKYGVDRPDFYGDIAKAWIEDAGRMTEYYEKMARKAKND